MTLIEGKDLSISRNRTAFVRWDNKTMEIDVNQIDIEYTHGYDNFGLRSHGGEMDLYVEPTAVAQLTGIIREIEVKKEGEDKMGRYSEDSCDKAWDESNDLTKDVLNLELDENKRKLIEHEVIREDGIITRRGIELVTQLWLQDADNVKKLVEKLDAVDAARKAKTSK